jgi:hypothetical protein
MNDLASVFVTNLILFFRDVFLLVVPSDDGCRPASTAGGLFFTRNGWQELAGLSPLWQELAGHGRTWQDMAGHGRTWQG